jgi:cytochrome o ubiquinol oxidase subunit 1
MGVTRRAQHFDDPSLQIWFVIAAIGAGLIALGIGAHHASRLCTTGVKAKL